MHGIFFYIGLGAGLAAACGLRPFLPLLLAGALASAGALGVDFAPALSVPARRLVAAGGGRRARARVRGPADLGLAPALDPRSSRQPPDPLAAALAGLALGAGALMFAGTLAAHRDAWWPGLLGGVARRGAGPAGVAPVIPGARSRLPDRAAREALTVYLDAASLLVAGARGAAAPARLRAAGAARMVAAAHALPRRGEVRRPADPAPVMAHAGPAGPRSSSCA